MLLTFIKNISDVRVSNVIQSSKVAHLNLHFTTVLFSSTFKGKLMTALNVFDFLHQFKRLKEFNRYNTTKSLQLFMMLDNTKRGRIWPAYKIKRSVLKACMSVRIFWSVVLFLTKSKSFELKKWRYRSESNSKRVWEEVLFITSPFFIEIAATGVTGQSLLTFSLHTFVEENLFLSIRAFAFYLPKLFSCEKVARWKRKNRRKKISSYRSQSDVDDFSLLQH